MSSNDQLIPTRQSGRYLSAIFGCVALFVGLAVGHMDTWPITHDEGVTLDQAAGPLALPRGSDDAVTFEQLYAPLQAGGDYGPAEVVHALKQRGMHPPLYYLMLNWRIRKAGAWPRVLMTQGVAIGIASVCAMVLLGATMTGRLRGGVIAGLLLAANPYHLYYALRLRPYGLAICLMIVSTLLMLRLRRAPTRRAYLLCAAGFALVSIAGCYTIYHYAFVLAWQLGFLLVASYRRPTVTQRFDLWVWAGVAACIAVGFAPWLGVLGAHLDDPRGAAAYFAAPAPLSQWPGRLASLVGAFVLFRRPVSTVELVCCAAAAVVTAGAFVRALRRGPNAGEQRLLWLCAALTPMCVAAADAWRGTHTLLFEHVMFPLFVLLMLWVTAGLSALRPRPATVLAIVWVALFIAADARLRARMREPSDVQRVAAWLARHDRADQTVVLSAAQRGNVYPLVYEAYRAGVRQTRLAGDVAGVDATEGWRVLINFAPPDAFDGGVIDAVDGRQLQPLDAAAPGWDDAPLDDARQWVLIDGVRVPF